MNDMKNIDQNTLSVQIRALLIYEFLNEYNRLEALVRKIFEENISLLSADFIQQLYFYNGGRIGTFVDVEEDAVRLKVVKYKENDVFKELKINQIIKMLKKKPQLEIFNFEIQSIQRSMEVNSFYDCMIRFLNMRNILAHEMSNIQFKNKDIVDLLSDEQLKKQDFGILKNYDIGKMDNMTKYIASNLVYIRKLIFKLKSLEAEKTVIAGNLVK